ncbi:MAG: hypothetical protein ABSG59_11050, partial [Verrucomicrobiota bacterium]
MKIRTQLRWFVLCAGAATFFLAQANASAQMLVNRWSFTNAVGMNTATDTVSSAVATLEGNALFDGTGDVTLDGSYGTFVSLPGGLLTNLAAVSFEGWVNASAVQVANNVHLFEFSD